MRNLIPDKHVKDIHSIDLDELWDQGFRGLLLDLDNTFVPYGKYNPVPDESYHWLNSVIEKGFKVAIYSNATKWKVDVVTENTGLFGVHKAMKPFTFKLGTCLKNLELEKEKVVIIGDQLFTDILGGNIAGVYTILVEPLDEKEFWGTKVLRFMEWAAGRKPLIEK